LTGNDNFSEVRQLCSVKRKEQNLTTLKVIYKVYITRTEDHTVLLAFWCGCGL